MQIEITFIERTGVNYRLTVNKLIHLLNIINSQQKFGPSY